MGYTHYCTQKSKLAQNKFNEFSRLVEKLLNTEDARDILAYEHDVIDRPAEITNQLVCFNGKGEDGHETFIFSRITEIEDYHEDKKRAFGFCKTARKPYDKYVVAVLILAKLIFGKDVTISSDGEINDWQIGKELVEKAVDFPIRLTQHKGGDFEVGEIETTQDKLNKQLELVKEEKIKLEKAVAEYNESKNKLDAVRLKYQSIIDDKEEEVFEKSELNDLMTK